MKETLDKFLKWVAGFFEENKTGIQSSKRLIAISGAYVTLLISLILAGLVVGLAIEVKSEIQRVGVIQIISDTIIYLCGLVVAGGSVNYVLGKRKEKDASQD